MTRVVDLDDIAGLECAWAELERVHAIRAIDPPLREAIERRLDCLDPDVAAPLRADLDKLHPDAWLFLHVEAVVPNRPMPGRSPRSVSPRPVPTKVVPQPDQIELEGRTVRAAQDMAQGRPSFEGQTIRFTREEIEYFLTRAAIRNGLPRQSAIQAVALGISQALDGGGWS